MSGKKKNPILARAVTILKQPSEQGERPVHYLSSDLLPGTEFLEPKVQLQRLFLFISQNDEND
jgi:hypothetical protein